MNNQLIEAVKEALGKDEYLAETMGEVCQHGADCGFSGFTYYHETGEFYAANRALIIEQLKQECEEFGLGMLEFIQSFRCLGESYSVDEIGEVVFGNDKEHDSYSYVANALAWYALESVSSHCVDNDEFEADEKAGEEE